MKTATDGSFTFTIPESSPSESERGEKRNGIFEYQVCENVEEATAILNSWKTDVLTVVNDMLKSRAKANAYATALTPHRPSEVAPEDIVERMVRDYTRLGIAEDAARSQVQALLNAK